MMRLQDYYEEPANEEYIEDYRYYAVNLKLDVDTFRELALTKTDPFLYCKDDIRYIDRIKNWYKKNAGNCDDYFGSHDKDFPWKDADHDTFDSYFAAFIWNILLVRNELLAKWASVTDPPETT